MCLGDVVPILRNERIESKVFGELQEVSSLVKKGELEGLEGKRGEGMQKCIHYVSFKSS